MVNTCIRCGEVIPEGRWFCPICEVEVQNLQRDEKAMLRLAEPRHRSDMQRNGGAEKGSQERRKAKEKHRDVKTCGGKARKR